MFFKNEIPEVPLWVSNDGDSSDSWFFQQLARFASERAGTASNVVVCDEFTNPPGDITFNAKPVALITLCPLNIGTGASYLRIWTDNATYIVSYNSAGPVYQVTILTSPTLASTRVDNGDGTWTLDTVTWGYRNSTTDPDYYAVFLQT